MVAIWFQGKHLPEASLSAFVAGEVEPPAQAAMAGHLEACAECRARLERVRQMHGLFGAMRPSEPDELTWRRIRERVRAQLESDAVPEHPTLDLLLGHRWVTAALATAVVIALLVWFAPRPDKVRVLRPTIADVGPPLPESHVVSSGAAPIELTLASGAHLSLAERTRLVADDSRSDDIRLQLMEGELSVRLTARPSDELRFDVYTPAFRAGSKSADFSIGYHANDYSVVVRDGQVELEGPTLGRRVLSEGERLEARAGQRPVLSRADGAPVEGPATAVEKTPAPTPPLEAAPDEPVVLPPSGASSSEGETTVVVEELPLDPVAAAWRAASTAYYRDRDLEKTITRALEVVRIGGDRPEVRLARQLLCDAQIATGRAEQALLACGELLKGANQDEARAIHYTLATIYRAQLKDCKNAIPHYNRAIVFGSVSLLDDEMRLYRAGCAVEVGDLDLAWRDVILLEPRAGRLARKDELNALKRRLNEVLGSGPAGRDSGQ